ncbi:MAG TPA: hypothetical protein VHC22_32475 [Pirellulales bacterium]|nr:hypothetical protein [Pirellulales bacterium]
MTTEGTFEDAQAAPVKLIESDDDPTVQLEMYGRVFTVRLWDINDDLSIIDKRHANDPKIKFADGTERHDPRFLDSVIGLLRDRYGVEGCSREGAWRFYSFVTGEFKKLRARIDAKKNSVGPTAESPTGSESTAETGEKSNGAPGSPTSNDATPNETCASAT